jgi:signal transduction histidine kinase
MWLAVTLSPVIDEKGGTLGLSVHVRNVSRRMEIEREAAHLQKMTALGAMAGGIAQNFNNVIGGVITSIDFAQSSDDPTLVRRLLTSAVTALMRASHLTQALLVFAEGDRSDTENADLVTTVRAFLKPLDAQFARRGIEVQTSLEPLKASVPLKRIQTILDRLISNAVEAMPQGGRLHIQLQREGQSAVLTVGDTGVGIASENLSRLFEPFFTTKMPETGDGAPPHVGLGLAVVHGVVRDLGGIVTITSRPDQGTTCTVRLPLKHP